MPSCVVQAICLDLMYVWKVVDAVLSPVSCLQEKTPDYDSYCLLAEAFLAIQEPDKAARAYEVRRWPGRFIVICLGADAG